MTSHSSEPTIFSFSHIESITLGAGEEVEEIFGGAIGLDVDRTAQVADRLLGCIEQVLQQGLWQE